MPRPRYPSDEARKAFRPHVKVHLSLANHPRFAEVVADPRARGILLGLWMVAARAYASATHDQVTLTKADLLWISGVDRADAARRAVIGVANSLGYKVEVLGKSVQITIRNFAKKQGFTPQTPPETPRSSAASYSDSDSDSDSDSPPTPPRGGAFLDARTRNPNRQHRQRAKAAGVEKAAIDRAMQALEINTGLKHSELRWISRTPGPLQKLIADVLAERPHRPLTNGRPS